MTAIGRCPDCKREWNVVGQAHCAECCAHFNSDFAFDRHRTADFQCVPVEEFSEPWRKTGKPRFVHVERADGLVWVTEAKSPAVVALTSPAALHTPSAEEEGRS